MDGHNEEKKTEQNLIAWTCKSEVELVLNVLCCWSYWQSRSRSSSSSSSSSSIVVVVAAAVAVALFMINVETSYFTQLKMCYLMTTFRCPSDILITSWLFTAWWSTWPGNHLVTRWFPVRSFYVIDRTNWMNLFNTSVYDYLVLQHQKNCFISCH